MLLRPMSLAWFVGALVAVAAGSCTHNTTLVRSGSGDGRVIYRLPEAQAFEIARGVLAEAFPDRDLHDETDGPWRGYWVMHRFGLDFYSQNVRIIPAVGTDAEGHEVHGFWFDVSGRGSTITGIFKNRGLYRRLREALDATGTAVAVTSVRSGHYESDARAYRAEGNDHPTAGVREPATVTTADQLRQLKAMRDEGLITNEEYEAKRRQLLDRM